MCEKPLGLDAGEVRAMYHACRDQKLVHMTAFTYRFIPAIRWMHRLIQEGTLGTLYHVRVRRLQDFEDRALGWRQQRALCGTGELGDMLAHRIDYVHYFIGSFTRLVANMKQCVRDRRRPDGTLQSSDVEDWVAVIGELTGGATAVLESTKMATGRGAGLHSEDFVEINGSNGTLVYRLERPHELLIGRPGATLEVRPVPDDLLTIPGAPRDPHAGDPLQGFRYDQSFEFVQAIVEGRPASPDFHDGSRVQAVIDAIVLSAERQQWVDVADARVPA
jgi:predicted dehydrogenase